MKKCLFIIAFISFWGLQGHSAVLHFYSNPSVPQPLFHVILEYKSFVYEADTHVGGRRFPAAQLYKAGDIQIEIADTLVDEPALQSQMGLPFDFQFVWDKQGTYCSKLVGIALDIPPVPMDFSGTHYVKYYPDWINRHDPGLSPDHIYDFGIQHAIKVIKN
jgi:hypothetical protein